MDPEAVLAVGDDRVRRLVLPPGDQRTGMAQQGLLLEAERVDLPEVLGCDRQLGRG